jgi:hypothetical protein
MPCEFRQAFHAYVYKGRNRLNDRANRGPLEASLAAKETAMKNRLAGMLFGALAAATHWACGGGSSSPTSPSAVAGAPASRPCSQSVLFQNSGAILANSVQTLGIGAPLENARLDVTVDWTLASNRVGVYVVQGACDLAQFNARNCTFIVRAEPGAKPVKGSGNVTAATAYTLFVANFGDRDDSGAIQLVLSMGACAPASASATLPRRGGAGVRNLQSMGR